MTTREFANKINVPLWKINKVNLLLINGYTIDYIQKTLNLKNAMVNKIVAHFIYKKRRNAIDFKEAYWENEDEMMIQEYKVEDLQGDELAYLESL